MKGKVLGRKVLGEVAAIVTPDTIRRCCRQLVAGKYDGSKKRGSGRPPTTVDIVALVVTMAQDDPSWGCTRLRGALAHLGHEPGRNTIKRILLDHGIELRTRKVESARYTTDPHGRRMQQIGGSLTDAVDGVLLGKRTLILDRDPLYTTAFRALLADAGCKVVRLPSTIIGNAPTRDNQLLQAVSQDVVGTGQVRCRERLGGREWWQADTLTSRPRAAVVTELQSGDPGDTEPSARRQATSCSATG